MFKRKMVAFLLAIGMLTLAACSNQAGQEGKKEDSSTVSGETSKPAESSKQEETSKPAETVKSLQTITLYPSNANLTSGVVSGIRGEFLAERGYQLEVWAYSPEKTNAILTSGDLPDIMYIPKENFEVMVEEGMLLNLDEYKDQLPHIYAIKYADEAFENVRETLSAGTGGLYGLPNYIGESDKKYCLLDSTDRATLKLNWDAYEQIGAPAFQDAWEMIDVLEQMVEACPEKDGLRVYGIGLYDVSNFDFWQNMYAYYAWHGYRTDYLKYLLELNVADQELTSILTKDSKYYEGLKWYNKCYKRGLLDPDSINTERATALAKVDAGMVMVPGGNFLGKSPLYMEYLLPDTSIYFDYITELGYSNYLIAINAETEHLEECLNFIDLMGNPDEYFSFYYGGDGDGIWYSDGKNVYLSEEYTEYLKAGNTAGDYYWKSGEKFEYFNTPYIFSTGSLMSYEDGKGNQRRFIISSFSEYQEITAQSDNLASWRKIMGYNSWQDLLADKNGLVAYNEIGETARFQKLPDDKMNLTIGSIADKVKEASWKMVYAESEAEFEKIWEQMVSDCEGLGAQEVIDWALKNVEQAVATARGK